MIEQSTIKFLKDLAKNNNKDWFETHRKNYETAKEDFANFVMKIISMHGKKDADIAQLKAKDCMFRINRDVRFSKDKSPYKTNMGASINRGGKKSIFSGYYIHIAPSQSFVGGGLWMPMPENLKKVRQEIDYNFDEFKSILNNKKFKTVYGDIDKSEGAALSRPPKGYDENNAAIEYLKMKNFIALQYLTDAELTDKNLEKKILTAFDALQPLVKFINRSLEE
ncbi:MAG: DUF2461 domain-containing protein [Chitinophagaceae bacterium]